MRVAYFDCASGISGDMTLGALLDVGVPFDAVQGAIDSLGIPGCVLEIETVKRKGFRGTKIHVRHPEQHAHRHLKHVLEILHRGALTPRQRELAERVFRRLAEAEAKVHGSTIEKVHFHEVGAIDSIVDIVGACVAWDLLGVDRALCSPIPTGQGFIEIAHGRARVPAPATAELLIGVPLAPSSVEAELTTPTGAALVATLVDDFCMFPPLTIERVGYGAGDKDFPSHPNLLRLVVGRTEQSLERDEVICLETNLDDCSGEWIGHCVATLFEAGALDVFTSSIQMKKNRPGVLLTALAPLHLRDTLAAILFAETSTIGVRAWTASRMKLPREERVVETPFGAVRGKVTRLPDGGLRFSPEFAACEALARASRRPLRDVMEAAARAFRD